MTDSAPMSTTTAESIPGGERTALGRARGIVLGILTVDVLVLLVTGVILFFTYRPSGSSAWGEVFGDDLESSVDLARATTTTHRLAAQIAVATAIAAGVLLVVEKRPQPSRLDIAVAIGLPAVVVVGSFTGPLLPWDQLGLWAVTVGTDMRGYRPLFDDDQIRFAILDGAQIAPSTIVRWLLVHTIAVGAALAALLTIAWHRTSRRPITPSRTDTPAR